MITSVSIGHKALIKLNDAVGEFEHFKKDYISIYLKISVSIKTPPVPISFFGLYRHLKIILARYIAIQEEFPDFKLLKGISNKDASKEKIIVIHNFNMFCGWLLQEFNTLFNTNPLYNLKEKDYISISVSSDLFPPNLNTTITLP